MTSQAPSRPTMNIGNAKHLLLQLLPEKDTTLKIPSVRQKLSVVRKSLKTTFVINRILRQCTIVNRLSYKMGEAGLTFKCVQSKLSFKMVQTE